MIVFFSPRTLRLEIANRRVTIYGDSDLSASVFHASPKISTWDPPHENELLSAEDLEQVLRIAETEVAKNNLRIVWDLKDLTDEDAAMIRRLAAQSHTASASKTTFVRIISIGARRLGLRVDEVTPEGGVPEYIAHVPRYYDDGSPVGPEAKREFALSGARVVPGFESKIIRFVFD